MWKERVAALSGSLNTANTTVIEHAAAKRAADARVQMLEHRIAELEKASAEKLEQIATARASEEVLAMSNVCSDAERQAAAALAEPLTAAAVSYTHLTLPTILLV